MKSVTYFIRSNLEKNLSGFFFNFIRKFYRGMFYILEFILSVLNYVLLFVPNLYFRHKKIYLFAFKKMGIGDRLIISSVLNNYKKFGSVVLANQTNDVYNNLGIKQIFRKNTYLNKMIISFLTLSYHSNIIGAFGDFHKSARNFKNKKHYINAIFNKRKDVLEKISRLPILPIVNFSEKEIRHYSHKYKYLIKKKYGIIMSGSYFEKNPTVKNISFKKIQDVVDKTKIRWIQVGLKSEPLLSKVIDFRGLSIRESFFIVSKAKVVFTTEGMLTHLAGAFDIPCLTVCTGFIYPEASRYKSSKFVQPDPLPDCAYCWDHICKKTGTSKAWCSKNIDIKEIINKIQSINI